MSALCLLGLSVPQSFRTQGDSASCLWAEPREMVTREKLGDSFVSVSTTAETNNYASYLWVEPCEMVTRE